MFDSAIVSNLLLESYFDFKSLFFSSWYFYWFDRIKLPFVNGGRHFGPTLSRRSTRLSWQTLWDCAQSLSDSSIKLKNIKVDCKRGGDEGVIVDWPAYFFFSPSLGRFFNSFFWYPAGHWCSLLSLPPNPFSLPRTGLSPTLLSSHSLHPAHLTAPPLTYWRPLYIFLGRRRHGYRISIQHLLLLSYMDSHPLSSVPIRSNRALLGFLLPKGFISIWFSSKSNIFIFF